MIKRWDIIFDKSPTELGCSCNMDKSEDGKYVKYDDYVRELEKLRHLVWLQDIPSPQCPEYIELHKKIQRILNCIDEMLEV